jgi:hypothetical protein
MVNFKCFNTGHVQLSEPADRLVDHVELDAGLGAAEVVVRRAGVSPCLERGVKRFLKQTIKVGVFN